MSNIGIGLAFVGAALIGGLATFYIVESDCQSTLRMLAQAQLAEGIIRAEGAYSTQSLAVARWELERLRDVLRSGFVRALEDDERIRFNSFLVSARLAKVCAELGDEAEAENNLVAALDVGRQFYPAITNGETLFGVLAEIDAKTSRKASDKRK